MSVNRNMHERECKNALKNNNNKSDVSDEGNEEIIKRKPTFKDKYDLIKKIGSGSFGEVYLCYDKRRQRHIALKVEDIQKGKTPKLRREYGVYKLLHKYNVPFIPQTYGYYPTKKCYLMKMKLLGASLDVLFEKNNTCFDIGTTLKLGIDMIEIMKNLHNAKIIHRDIKPNNFMVGKEDPENVYIMDFGLAKQYIKNGKHIKHKTGKPLIGTARYTSVNVHMGIEPCRRDELEAIGYMLVYFLKGKLPWQGLKKKGQVMTRSEQIEKIGNVKIAIKTSKICEDIPECFNTYIDATKSLKFFEDPDYDYLKSIFRDYAGKNGIKLEYSWVRDGVDMTH